MDKENYIIKEKIIDEIEEKKRIIESFYREIHIKQLDIKNGIEHCLKYGVEKSRFDNERVIDYAKHIEELHILIDEKYKEIKLLEKLLK